MADTGHMMRLGGIIFSASTRAYDSLSRNEAYQWVEQSRLNSEPALQYMGLGKNSISFKGTVYPSLDATGGGDYVGVNQIEKMRIFARLGKPLELTDAFGNVFGLWCILSINETASMPHRDGSPRKQEFTISIQRYAKATDFRSTTISALASLLAEGTLL